MAQHVEEETKWIASLYGGGGVLCDDPLPPSAFYQASCCLPRQNWNPCTHHAVCGPTRGVMIGSSLIIDDGWSGTTESHRLLLCIFMCVCGWVGGCVHSGIVEGEDLDGVIIGMMSHGHGAYLIHSFLTFPFSLFFSPPPSPSFFAYFVGLWRLHIFDLA